MKDQRRNGGNRHQPDYSLLLGQPGVTKQVETPEPEIEPTAAMNFLLGIGKQVKKPAESTDQGFFSQLVQPGSQFPDFITDVPTPVEAEPISSVIPEPDQVTVEDVIAGVRTFTRYVIDNLEGSAASLKLSTGKLFNAGLQVAITQSLFELLGVTVNDDGSYTLPDEETQLELEADYELISAFSQLKPEAKAEIEDFLTNNGDEFEGFDPSWETILNDNIATMTSLTVDDSLIITSLLAETWCSGRLDETDDSDDDDGITGDLEALANILMSGHHHCEDGEDDICGDYDDEVGTISVSMETDQSGIDILTLEGIDERELEFFIDYEAMVKDPGPNPDSVINADELWSWLKCLMPALTVKTKHPERYLDINDQCYGDMRFVVLVRADDGSTTLGLYTFEEGLFPQDQDGRDMLRVIHRLFEDNITGTALSQEKRVMAHLDDLMMKEEDAIEMLRNGGVEIDDVADEDKGEITPTAEPVTEPVEKVVDDAVTVDTEVGLTPEEIDAMLVEPEKKVDAVEDEKKITEVTADHETKTAVADESLIFKPISRKRHD